MTCDGPEETDCIKKKGEKESEIGGEEGESGENNIESGENSENTED